MQYSQEHLKTMVYAEFGGQTECIMGNWKIVNRKVKRPIDMDSETEDSFRRKENQRLEQPILHNI